MMKKITLTFLLSAGLLLQSSAQVQQSGWLASFNTFKLSEKMSLHFDGQLRSSDKWENVQTILLRPGLNYHYKKWVFTAGYAYIGNRRTVNQLSELLPEHRLWQQVIINHKISKAAVAHRFRFEERFIAQPIINNNELEAGDFEEAFRLRYFIRNVVPVTKLQNFSKGFFVALQNEVFLNTGNKRFVNGKTFDQNRLYLAVGYRLPGKIDLETGYMNQYVNTRNDFINNHIVQFAVYKRL